MDQISFVPRYVISITSSTLHLHCWLNLTAHGFWVAPMICRQLRWLTIFFSIYSRVALQRTPIGVGGKYLLCNDSWCVVSGQRTFNYVKSGLGKKYVGYNVTRLNCILIKKSGTIQSYPVITNPNPKRKSI